MTNNLPGPKRQVRVRLDYLDAMAIAGSALLGIGLWMVFPPATFIVLGSILLALGIFGARK